MLLLVYSIQYTISHSTDKDHHIVIYLVKADKYSCYKSYEKFRHCGHSDETIIINEDFNRKKHPV